MIRCLRFVLVTLMILTILQNVSAFRFHNKKPATERSANETLQGRKEAAKETKEAAKVEKFQNTVTALTQDLMGCLLQIGILTFRLPMEVAHFDPDAVNVAIKLALEIIKAFKDLLHLNMIVLPADSQQYKFCTKIIRSIEIIEDFLHLIKSGPKKQIQTSMQLMTHILTYDSEPKHKSSFLPSMLQHLIMPLPVDKLRANEPILNPVPINKNSIDTLKPTDYKDMFQKNAGPILQKIILQNLKPSHSSIKPKPISNPVSRHKVESIQTENSVKVAEVPRSEITQPSSDNTTRNQTLRDVPDTTTDLPMLQASTDNSDMNAIKTTSEIGKLISGVSLANGNINKLSVKLRNDVLKPSTPLLTPKLGSAMQERNKHLGEATSNIKSSPNDIVESVVQSVNNIVGSTNWLLKFIKP